MDKKTWSELSLNCISTKYTDSKTLVTKRPYGSFWDLRGQFLGPCLPSCRWCRSQSAPFYIQRTPFNCCLPLPYFPPATVLPGKRELEYPAAQRESQHFRHKRRWKQQLDRWGNLKEFHIWNNFWRPKLCNGWPSYNSMSRTLARVDISAPIIARPSPDVQ